MLAQIALLVFASARRRRLADASEIYYTETLKASPLSDGWVWVFAPCALVLIIVVCITAIFCNNVLNPHRLVLIGVYVDTPHRI